MSGMHAMLPLTQVLRAGERRENEEKKRKTEGDRDTTICSSKRKEEKRKTGERDANVMCSALNFHRINNSS